MSTPECPPFRPDTFTRHAASPDGLGERHLAPPDGLHAARAADAQRSRLFVVEVEKVLRLQHSALELRRARQAGFFVDREHELQRTVRDVRAFHHCQRRRNAHAVVGAQRRALGLQPVAVAPHVNRIGIEIVRRAFVLLAHHVEVSLQQSRGRLLASRTRRLAHHHVAGGILRRFQPQLLGLLQHIAPRGSFLGRSPRRRRQHGKMFPKFFRFQIYQYG